MKLLILSFYYYPDLCAGSFRCTALVSQLKKIVGDEGTIEVLTTMPNRYASYDIDAEALEIQDKVTIRRIAIPSHQSGFFDQAKAFLYFAYKVRQITKHQDYDLVFATSSRLMTAVLGAWVSRKKQSKLYLDIRDLFVDTMHSLLKKPIGKMILPIFSRLEQWTFNQADRINLVSKGFADYMQDRYPHIRLSWYSNGIDPEFLSINPYANNEHQSGSVLNVVYAGNIGEGQGLHRIIPQLATRLKDQVHFKIIGDGGKKNCLVESVKGMKQVELCPPMDRQQLISAYQQADILFLHLNDYPAFRQVLPSKLFEYAAMGKPIWAGVAGYAAQFVEEEIENAVIFHPCDVDGAVRVLSALSLTFSPREAFIHQYARESLMYFMARDILSVIFMEY